MKIFKYRLQVVDYQEIQMPEGAEILTVQVLDGVLCLWAKVDPDNKLVNRKFAIIGTGNPMPEDISDYDYVGTVQMSNFVWHVFNNWTSAWYGEK